MAMLLWLSVCAVTFIKLTSSQHTYDISVQDNDDVSSCGSVDQVGPLLCQIQTAVTRLMTAVSMLQRDVARLKSANAKGCPAGFFNISSLSGCYKVVTDRIHSWTEAGRTCQSLHEDAHLVIINDAQEQSAVASLLASVNKAGCHQYILTAGQRIDPSRESTFVWRVSSTTAVYHMNYTNWGPGEPQYGLNGEACMGIDYVRSYMWHDLSCDYATCSLCELDM